MRNLGLVIVVILMIAVPHMIAIATRGDLGGYWAAVIPALIVVIWLGLYLEKKTIRRGQR